MYEVDSGVDESAREANLAARDVVTPVGPPVQGYDRDVAGLFQRKYPVGGLGGGAIEKVRNEGDAWPVHGRGPTAGNATRFRAAGGNHDVMSVGQGHDCGAFGVFGIEPSTHMLDFGSAKRL